MRMERIHQGVANDVERLKYIIKEHMLKSAPSLVSLWPPLKIKKRNDTDIEDTQAVTQKTVVLRILLIQSSQPSY